MLPTATLSIGVQSNEESQSHGAFSVLALELYAMAHGFGVASVLKATTERIMQDDRSTLEATTERALQKPLPLTICTDSKSLYDCLVKLGTTQEKRLNG